MPTMKAIQVSAPGSDFELVDRGIPEPKEGEVLIKVKALLWFAPAARCSAL